MPSTVIEGLSASPRFVIELSMPPFTTVHLIDLEVYEYPFANAYPLMVHVWSVSENVKVNDPSDGLPFWSNPFSNLVVSAAGFVGVTFQ